MHATASRCRGYALVLTLVLALVLLSGTALLVWWSGLQARTARALRFRLASLQRATYLAARLVYLHNQPDTGPRFLDRRDRWQPDAAGVWTLREPQRLFPDFVNRSDGLAVNIWRDPPAPGSAGVRLFWSLRSGVRTVRGHIDILPLILTNFDLALGRHSHGRLRVQTRTTALRWAWLNPRLDLRVTPRPRGEVWTADPDRVPGPLAHLRRRRTPTWPALTRWFDADPWRQAAQRAGVCGSAPGLFLAPDTSLTRFFQQRSPAPAAVLEIRLDQLDLCHPGGLHYQNQPLPGRPRAFNGIIWSEVPLRLTGTLRWPCDAPRAPATLWVLVPGPHRLELRAPLGLAGPLQRMVVVHPGATRLEAHDAAWLRTDLFLDGPVHFATPVRVQGSVHLNGPLTGDPQMTVARCPAPAPQSPGPACVLHHWLYRARLVPSDFS